MQQEEERDRERERNSRLIEVGHRHLVAVRERCSQVESERAEDDKAVFFTLSFE